MSDGGRIMPDWIAEELEKKMREMHSRPFPGLRGILGTAKEKYPGHWPYGTVIEHKAGIRAMYVGRRDKYLHDIIRLGVGISRPGDEEAIDNAVIENWSPIDEG